MRKSANDFYENHTFGGGGSATNNGIMNGLSHSISPQHHANLQSGFGKKLIVLKARGAGGNGVSP